MVGPYHLQTFAPKSAVLLVLGGMDTYGLGEKAVWTSYCRRLQRFALDTAVMLLSGGMDSDRLGGRELLGENIHLHRFDVNTAAALVPGGMEDNLLWEKAVWSA